MKGLRLRRGSAVAVALDAGWRLLAGLLNEVTATSVVVLPSG